MKILNTIIMAFCFLLTNAMVVRGLHKGEIRVRRKTYARTADPTLFWFYIIFYFLLGAVIFFLWFKYEYLKIPGFIPED